jgi:hypothetical protein
MHLGTLPLLSPPSPLLIHPPRGPNARRCLPELRPRESLVRSGLLFLLVPLPMSSRSRLTTQLPLLGRPSRNDRVRACCELPTSSERAPTLCPLSLHRLLSLQLTRPQQLPLLFPRLPPLLIFHLLPPPKPRRSPTPRLALLTTPLDRPTPGSSTDPTS